MIEYEIIKDFYGDKVAKRSQVPLINHIDEGLRVLDEIEACEAAKAAFCLHPIVQGDEDCRNNLHKILNCSPIAIAYAMEYRHIANNALVGIVHKWADGILSCQPIELSPLTPVNKMLIADKVQNRKDYELYHQGTHELTEEYDLYFREWLRTLGVSEKMYQELAALIS